MGYNNKQENDDYQKQKENQSSQQKMSQQQQQSTMLQRLASFIQLQSSSPLFEDYYLLFACRLLIYIYVLILLSNILMGYEKLNVKARVYRKFFLVYSKDILEQMEIDDMKDLEVTINNTIENATKEMKGITVEDYHHNGQMTNNHGLFSQRKALRSDQTSQTSLGKKPSRIKFDLLKNEYFDPPGKKAHERQSQLIPTKSSLSNNKQIIEGQCEQQILSPIPRFPRKQINFEKRQQVNAHYNQQEKSEKNLLHLQDQIVTNIQNSESQSADVIQDQSHHIDN